MNSLTNLNKPIISGSLADAYGTTTQQSAPNHSASNLSAPVTDKLASTSASHNNNNSDAELVLSPRAQRAQKIEAMARDFFQTGDFSSEKLPSLIQRLYQDGILSQGQLNRLSDSGFDIPSTHSQSLSAFIDEQRATLTDSADDKTLGTTLDEAAWVMATMDTIQSPIVAQKANRVANDLNTLLATDRVLTDQQNSQYQGLKSLMQLAAMSGEHQQPTGQLNSYLALSKPH
ncbi:hypothetical protein N9W21_00220 [Shewanella sp.]|nr:hypothetical protein [Shewanella sp.]